MKKQTRSTTDHACKSPRDSAKGCTESVQLERILNNLPSALREREKRIPQMLTDYQKRRAELGALLAHVQEELAPKQQFCRYLRLRKIPRQTAYDLIADHQQPDKPERKKPKVYTPAEHREARYRVLACQVKAHFSPLRNDPDLKAKLETFFREIAEGLGLTVEVREA